MTHGQARLVQWVPRPTPENPLPAVVYSWRIDLWDSRRYGRYVGTISPQRSYKALHGARRALQRAIELMDGQIQIQVSS